MPIPIQNKAFPIKRRKIEDTLVSWDSVTTADGNVGGGSLIDTGLIGSNDFITNQVTVIILGGAANLERQLCTAFNPATGEIDFSPLSAQIVAGTPYRLTGLMSPEVSVAGLAAALAVPLPDSVANLLMRDVVGNKTDTPVSSVSATASLTAYIKGIVNSANGTGKIYFGITVPAAGSMTIDNDVLCIGDINIGAGGTLTINGDCHCVGSIAVGTNLGGGAALTVNGDLHCTTAIYNWDLSHISITGDCYGTAITNTTGQVSIDGNYNCYGGSVSNTTGRFNIHGNFNGPSAQITQLDPTANGDFYINGDCTVNSIETSGSDAFEIYGNLYCSGVTLDAPAGSLTVDGNANLSSGLNCSQDAVNFSVIGDCSIFSAFTLGAGTSGQINVNGKLTAKYGFATMAGSTINTGELESGSSVTVEGTATFMGELTSQSSITVADGATLQASATFISISDFVINGVVIIHGNLTVSEGNVFVGSGKSILAVTGDLFVCNELTNATGIITVLGKCTIITLLQTDAGSIITNDLRTFNLENNGAGTIQIEGDCFVAGPFQNLAGGSISILKDLTVGSDVTNLGTLTLGPLTCNGNITNSGTITSNGGILYVGTYTNTGTVNNKMYKSP
jgi:hypothetical protein